MRGVFITHKELSHKGWSHEGCAHKELSHKGWYHKGYAHKELSHNSNQLDSNHTLKLMRYPG